VRNPAAAADPPAAVDSRATALTAKELGRFLEQVKGDRLFALGDSRRRPGCGVENCSASAGSHSILRAARSASTSNSSRPAGGVSFGPPKSKRSRRKVALDNETVEALEAHREAQLLERAFAAGSYVDGDLVFCDELGGPINPTRLTEALLRHRKAAGIPAGTLHLLRHSHTTHALSSGVPVHVVAARIGDRPETVLRTYAHLLPTSDAEAAEQVAALIA
jgi:integrase